MCQQNWTILVAVVCAAYIKGCQGSDITVLSPPLVESAENTNVTLTCSYEGQYSGNFVWYLNKSHSLPFKVVMVGCTVPTGSWLEDSIYSYTCANSTTHSVTIKSITQQMHGETWQCEFNPGASAFKSNISRILVTVPVIEATITSTPDTSNNILTIAEVSTVTWKCTSSPCQPKPKFRWYIKKDQNSTATILPETISSDSITGVIQTYTSTLITPLNRTLNGWLICCGSGYPYEVLSKTILINVTYPPNGPPTIDNFVNGREIKVIRYGFVNLTCSVTGGNPLPKLDWNNNNGMQQIVSDTVTTRISWQANDLNRVELRCQSTYLNYLINATSVFVNVLYSPEKPVIKIKHSSGVFILVNNTLTVIEGQPIILNCSAESNPSPTFEWNYWSWTTPGFILNVTSAIGHHSQVITCKASNKMETSYPETSMTIGSNTTYFALNVLYPPTMKTMDNITLKEGQNLTYSCNYENGNPDVTNITWSWMNKTWTGRQLDINNVSRNQAGLYRCSVQNFMMSSDGTQEFGNASGQFYLLVQNKTNPEKTNNGTSAPLSNASLVITGAAAGTTGGVVLILVFIIVIIFYKRRLNNKKQCVSGQYIGLKDANDKTMELNHDVQKIDKNECEQSPGLPERQIIDTGVNGLQELDDYDDKIQTDYGIYGNDYSRIKRIERIEVVELFPYLTDKTAEFFATDYAKLPQGLTKPYEFSQKPENIALNRYHGIYPYDHSRVKIPGSPGYFINACYIDGYKRKKAYIASLGPLSKTSKRFVMFWQMVWSEKSDVIVMLTKLTEPSGVKCDQYWPKDGSSEAYGEVTVTSTGEETFSDYIIRTFSMMKGSQKRNLKHFHFMAWPDKSIPADVTCLLEFRRSVRASHSSGPLIVHCSAGIGRTGTLIAIDMLIEEGQKKGSVNVLECVKTMRDQRVNMVQTLDQYFYIYKALVNALVFDNEAIPAEKIHKYVETSKLNRFSDMFKTFNLSVETDTTIENNSRNVNKALKEKNRVGSDIPGDANRVRLFLNRGMEASDYINAMYLNSFTVADHFIAAQSPLPNGVEDFLCLIYQENCCCVVSMDGEQARQSTGSYVPPDNSSFTAGNYNVQCSRLDTKETYVVRKLKIEINGQIKGAEKVVYHFQFLGWLDGNKVPNDPLQFVEFTEDVERFAGQFGAEGSHVLVHCLNAFERSCLFCAVVAMIEKIKHEKEVCIPNTLRQIRTKRKLAIPTLEQFKFCYQATDAFVSKEKAETSNAENSYMNVTMT